MNYKFKVSGMMCGHCTARVEKALMSREGVFTAKAELETGVVSVDCAETLSRAQVAEFIGETGYTVEE